jgi:molybdate transport system substrate-binding protein
MGILVPELMLEIQPEATMKKRSTFAAAICLASGFLVAGAELVPANAAEIKIMAPRAIQTVLAEAGPAFERATGHKLNVNVDLAAVVVRRVNSGEAFDIAVATPQQIDALVKEGKLLADTRADLTRAGIGVEVKKGAPKPDISTVDAFKRAMLNAKTIGYLKIGTSGAMVRDALAKIGLTEAVKDKLILPEDDVVSEMVAEGKIEIAWSTSRKFSRARASTWSARCRQTSSPTSCSPAR